MGDALREELEFVRAKKLEWQRRAVKERERAERAEARIATLEGALRDLQDGCHAPHISADG